MAKEDSKSKAEEFYESIIGHDSSSANSEVLHELRQLNQNVQTSNTYLKYLVWFLVFLPIIAGVIYAIFWLNSRVE
jgi:hypothetical protein